MSSSSTLSQTLQHQHRPRLLTSTYHLSVPLATFHLILQEVNDPKTLQHLENVENCTQTTSALSPSRVFSLMTQTRKNLHLLLYISKLLINPLPNPINIRLNGRSISCSYDITDVCVCLCVCS